MGNGYFRDKELRATVAAEHTEEMANMYKDEISDAIKNTREWGPDFLIRTKDMYNDRLHDMWFGVYDMDSVSAAFSCKPEDKICILNFASYKHPGGMFLKGSSAQEESLCHASFLYNVLKEKKEYYAWNNKNLNKALYEDRALYSENILFFSDKCDVRSFDVLTCAAPNIGAGLKYGNVTKKENSEVLERRIQFLLSVAQQYSPDVLILGAFGCGVFKQDPYEVAECFKHWMSYVNIKTIMFAIPTGFHGRNSVAFKKVFGRNV